MAFALAALSDWRYDGASTRGAPQNQLAASRKQDAGGGTRTDTAATNGLRDDTARPKPGIKNVAYIQASEKRPEDSAGSNSQQPRPFAERVLQSALKGLGRGCAMNEEARKIWRSPQGVSLFKKMLGGVKPDQISNEDRETLSKLEQADPSKIRQPSANAPSNAREHGMNEEARRKWKTSLEASVLSKWMIGELLTPQEQEQLQAIKRAGWPGPLQMDLDLGGGVSEGSKDDRR